MRAGSEERVALENITDPSPLINEAGASASKSMSPLSPIVPCLGVNMSKHDSYH